MFSPLQLKLNQQVASAKAKGLDVRLNGNDEDVKALVDDTLTRYRRHANNRSWVEARAIELLNLRRFCEAHTWLPAVGMLECEAELRAEGFYIPLGQRIPQSGVQYLPHSEALVPVIFPEGWILQPTFDWTNMTTLSTRALLGDPNWNARMIISYNYFCEDKVRASITAVV